MDIQHGRNMEVIEAGLLGYLLLNCDYFQDAIKLGLEDKHFFLIRHGIIYGEMQKQWKDNQAFDTATIQAGIVSMGEKGRGVLTYADGDGFLRHIASESFSANFLRGVEEEAKTIIQGYWERRLLKVAGSLATSTSKGYSPEELGANFTAEYKDYMAELNNSTEQVNAAKVAKGVEFSDLVLSLHSDYLVGNKPKLITTGITSLDTGLGGGFEPGTHIGFLAASGTGKTVFLKQMMLEFARRGNRVVYYLMESTGELLARRVLAEMMHVNPRYLKTNITPPDPDCPKCKDLPPAQQYVCSCRKAYKSVFERAYSDAVQEWQGLSVKVEPRPLHLDRWRDDFIAEYNRKPIDVAIFDYGQKVQYDKSHDVNSAHARFADDISAIALEYRTLAFTALQVKKENNAGITRPPQVNDIKGTTAWYNACDYILSLFRPKISVDSMGNDVHDTKGTIHFIKTRDSAGLDAPVNVELVSDGLYFKPITLYKETLSTAGIVK